MDFFLEDLSIHLHERSPATLDEVGQIAGQFLKYRGRELHREENINRKIAVTGNPNDQIINNNCNNTISQYIRQLIVKLENTSKNYNRCFNCSIHFETQSN